MDDDTITWKIYEFEHHKKSADWYWILGIVALSLALISIFLDNILFAILVAIGAFTVALYASKSPKLLEVTLSKRGIHIDSETHPWGSLESFWIDDTREHHTKLLLTSKKTLATQLIIPLGDVSHEEVRAYLLRYIEEMPQGESVIERVMELVRF